MESCVLCGFQGEYDAHVNGRQHRIAVALFSVKAHAAGSCPCGLPKDHTSKPLHGQADIDSYIREAKALLATLTDEERGRWKVTWTGTEGA